MKKKGVVSLLIALVLLVSPTLVYPEGATVISFEEKYNDHQSIFLLYDVDIKVNEDWSYVKNVRKRVKILKTEARDMGEIPIYYENNREKVTNLKAFTVTPDNKKHDYSKIQDLNVYDGYPMYSDFRVKVITLPEVTVGSVLEYALTTSSKGYAMKNAFWYGFYMDWPAPMKEMNFSITFPKSLGLQYKEFGLTRKPKITENKSTITYSWAVRDIEGTKKDEDYLPLPTPESIKEGFEFSSVKSWRDISDWYYLLVKKNLIITPEIEATVKRVTADCATIKEKTRAILEYGQKDFRYVSMAFGDNTLEPHATDIVFKNKYGDCKDLSLLCMAALKVAGIDSNICFFNIESSINDPQYDLPIPSLFNHALLLVRDPKDGDFYIDPLLEGYDIGQYPLGYQGGYTFIITEDGGKFGRFPVFDEKRNYTSANRTVFIGEDSSALIESELLWDLDFSVAERARLKALSKEDKDEFFQKVDSYIASGGQMLERRIEGIDNKYGPITAHSKLKRTGEFPVTDGMMIIDISGYDRTTSFTAKERRKPIFNDTNSLNVETTTYRIPNGYSISYVPPEVDLDIGFFSIKRKYVKGKTAIKVTEVTRYKRLELPKEDYNKVKDFFDQLPVKTQQRIIVKKIQ